MTRSSLNKWLQCLFQMHINVKIETHGSDPQKIVWVQGKVSVLKIKNYLRKIFQS